MAYSGFLIKVGNYTIPMDRFIRAESYNITRQVQDLDSYRDANGVLHRTALEHYVHKAEFETPTLLTNTDIAELFGNIRNNYIVPAERKAIVTVYVPELDSYETQKMYMPDPQFSIFGTYDDIVRYNPVRIAFIGY